MDLKNTAITAHIVIESLVGLLENEGVDISSVTLTVGSKATGYESPDLELQKLIDLALLGLVEIKNGELTE